MKRLVLILVLILLWPVAGYSRGYYIDGNKLMDRCDGTKSGEPKADVDKYNTCVWYLAGVSDASVSWQVYTELQPKVVCFPDKPSEQLRRTVVKYMRQRPEEWHFSAGGLVLNAFREAWPCKE